jgi:ribosomal protein L33
MAKKKVKEFVCFQSTESPYRYFGLRKRGEEKITLRKYDRILRKHVIFEQTKLK